MLRRRKSHRVSFARGSNVKVVYATQEFSFIAGVGGDGNDDFHDR